MWDNKIVNLLFAMEYSFRYLNDWKSACKKSQAFDMQDKADVSADKRWRPPDIGTWKLNVDASFVHNAEYFTVGMVIRDHVDVFIECMSMTLPRPGSLFEAESIGVKETLSWLTDHQGRKFIVETDSPFNSIGTLK